MAVPQPAFEAEEAKSNRNTMFVHYKSFENLCSAARPLGFPSSRRPSTTSRGCSPRSPLPAAIFESLQLTVTYFHKTHEAEVEIVLRDDGTTWSGDGQVNAVPPVGPGSVLRRLQRLIRRISLA